MGDFGQLRLAVDVETLAEPRVERNVVYVVRDGQEQKADLFLPSASSAPFPTVLLIHGQGAEPIPDIKNWMVFQDWGRLLSSRGLAAFVFNQRETGGMLSKRYLAADDIAAALDFISSKASDQAIDSTRIALLAFSAGVPQVARAAFESEGIRCVVCVYGAMHLEAFRPKVPADAPQAAWDALLDFSCQHQMTIRLGRIPSTLVVRAGLDTPVINTSINDYIQESLRLNAPVQLLNVPEGRHGFDTLDHAPASRRAILSIVEFLLANLTG